MDTAKITREMESLPPEAQKEVIDFLAFLKTRYPSSPVAKRTKQAKLTDEPFIGMWRDRKDMQDSTAWVRNLRQCQ
jgi:hypothetical protein